MRLTEEDKRRIAERVRMLEARLPVQAVASVVEKSDAYPEVPWRAFALGISLAAVSVLLLDWRHLAVLTPSDMVMIMPLAGLAMMALAVLIAPLARLFVTAERAEAEARQQAEAQFLSHELFATRERCGILLFASLFERRVIVLVDRGLRTYLSEADLSTVAQATSAELKQSRIAEAFDAGFRAVEVILLAKGLSGSGGANEIERTIIEGEGHA